MITYFLCPKPDAPSGGVAFIYELANLYAESGHSVRVIQTEPFTTWWINEIIDDNLSLPWSALDRITRNDLVIIPEVMWPIETKGRQLVFLQNWGYLNTPAFRDRPAPLMVCSRYLFNWCRRQLQQTPIGIVTPYPDQGIFTVSPKSKDHVLIMARRNPKMADHLAVRLIIEGFEVRLVEGPVSQAQLARAFDQAEYYVHHAEPEGFPLLCAEAMLSGTLVVGSTGGGGNEFMHEGETAMCVAGPLMGHYSDPVLFVDRVVEKLKLLQADANLRSRMWQQAEAWVRLRYSRERTASQLEAVLAGFPK